MENKIITVEDFVRDMCNKGLARHVASNCNVQIPAVWKWLRLNKVPEDKKIMIVKAFGLNPTMLLKEVEDVKN